MNKNGITTKTKKAVDDISTKISDLKNKISQNKTSEINEGVQSALDKLDDLNQEIQKQYNLISNAQEKGNTQMSEMEKNISNNIKSFNNALTKASSLFKSHKEL